MTKIKNNENWLFILLYLSRKILIKNQRPNMLTTTVCSVKAWENGIALLK